MKLVTQVVQKADCYKYKYRRIVGSYCKRDVPFRTLESQPDHDNYRVLQSYQIDTVSPKVTNIDNFVNTPV